MIEKLTRYLIKFPPNIGIEARILYGVCFVTGVAGLLAGLVSMGPLQAPTSMVSVCLLGSMAGFVGWYLGRFHNLFIPSFIVLLFTQITALTFVFFYDGGIHGPAVFFFVTWIPVYIFILRAPFAFFAGLIFFTVFTALYFLEIQNVITPVDYSSDTSRDLDLYAGFSFHFFLTAIIAICAKVIFETAQKNIEASNRAKSQFLANISHEIRTPMNAIFGLNELALNQSSDNQQKIWLKSSLDAAQHLLSLLEEMLDISSIDEGKLVIVDRLFPVRELVTDIVNILRQFADAKKLHLDVSINPEVPRLVEADPVRLRQILVNLINNAIKFTDEGTIQLSVSMEKSLPGGTQLLFSIRDTGIGIASDQQEKVFDIFTQGENIDRFKHKGFGLGLSISRQLVEKMDGRIWLESPPTGGTTFFFTLPVTLPVTTPNREATQQTNITTFPETKKPESQLLLVEDNDINADVARLILQKYGFAVDRVIDGSQALNQLATCKYALILMDLEMPIMDGFETTQALRSGRAGPLNQHTPIIAVTAHALNEYREKSFAMGMQGFIAKPFSSDFLVREINRFVKKSSHDFQI